MSSLQCQSNSRPAFHEPCKEASIPLESRDPFFSPKNMAFFEQAARDVEAGRNCSRHDLVDVPDEEETEEVAVRFPPSVMELLERAAAIRKVSLEKFIVAAAKEEAEDAVGFHTRIDLDEEDQHILADDLEEPKVEPADDFILQARANYKRTVRSGYAHF